MSDLSFRRDAMWARLEGAEVDLVVVGGGITGTGVARDAARRGLRVALVEQRDLAYGTSSRSSKLVHGGLRYLEQGEVSMVFESVSERRTLMHLAPHLVTPLPFLFPVYERSKKSLTLVRLGMWLYDALALFRSYRRHVMVDRGTLSDREPALRQEGLRGSPLYYDCATDDARLTLETALDAAAAGAIVATGARVRRLVKNVRGEIAGVVVEDTLRGVVTTVRAPVVVNATGPWTDALRRLSSLPGKERRALLRPTKGVHVVVERQKLPVNHAVVLVHPDDGRVLFALPWGDRSYLGTTDTDYRGAPEEVAATAGDVAYLLGAAAHYFPAHPLDPGDVLSTWAGLRPLIAPPDAVSASQVSREHEVLTDADGLVTVAGGKLTTYRHMAEEVVEAALAVLRARGVRRPLEAPRTAEDPLPGGRGFPIGDPREALATLTAEVAELGDFDEATAAHLAATYGTRARALASRCAADASWRVPLVRGRPEIEGQVRWAAREELAASVEDVLVRRTQLFFRDHDQGLGCAPRVADLLAEELGWSARERDASLAAYRAEVALGRQWKRSGDGRRRKKRPEEDASAVHLAAE
ncbi:MAG: glycerol-3-phosphate dehydrogenase/oxidase [Myxococcota bacterium]